MGIPIARDWDELTLLLTSPSSSPVQIAFAPNGCFAMAPLTMNGFMLIAQSCSNHEKRRDFEKCVTHSNSEFPVTDNLNEMLQLLIAPSKTSAVLYRGLYVLLPKLMYALIGAYGAKLSSDSGSHVPQSASAAVDSSSGAATSASVVSQSASAAVVSSLGSASVVSQSASAAVVSSLGSASVVSQSASSAEVSSSSDVVSAGASPSSRAC